MSTTATRSAAHIAFTIAQPLQNLTLSRTEEMLALGISEADFADRAHEIQLVEVEPTPPNYRETPGADVVAYKFEQRALFGAMRQARMDESKRIEGASKYLGQALTSWKQLTPESMRQLRQAISNGHLTREWELAGEHESAVESRELPGVDEDDFARIVD